MALIRNSLWNTVNGAEIIPNSWTDVILHTKYLSQKDHDLMTVVLSVEPSLLYLIGDPDYPAVAWKKLADQFQKKI